MKEKDKEMDLAIVPPHHEEIPLTTAEQHNAKETANNRAAKPRPPQQRQGRKERQRLMKREENEVTVWKNLTQTANRFWGMLFNNTTIKGEMHFQKIDANTLKQMLTGVAAANLLRRYWTVFLLTLLIGSINITLGYLCASERQKIQRLEKRLIDIRYRSLEISSEVREKSLGSHIERTLVDSSLNVATEAPYQLLIDAED